MRVGVRVEFIEQEVKSVELQGVSTAIGASAAGIG